MSNYLHASLNSEQLSVQDYNKNTIQAGVIHLGVGAFHRAHQAVYFDRLLSHDTQRHWGITGVNIRPQDSQHFTRFMQQQGEYVLKTMAADGETHYEHIRSIVQQIDGAQTPEAVDALMADERTQLVTSTVTEGGYYLDENRRLMLEHPAIKADVEGSRNTLYAFLYAGLKQRSQVSNAKITLLCCDNLRHNGELLNTGLLQFLAAKQDEALIKWVEQHVSFPCSMVDRITPKPSQQHVDDVRTRFGIDDEMTVMGEDFIQWVVEDNFAGQKPALDLVGVQFVDKVDPFEEAKIRILNAGHTCVTYQAALKGLTYFDEAMRDNALKQYFTDFILQDSIPAIGDSVVDLPAYFEVIAQRFSNANIGDTIERICTDGYAKFPIFVFPTLEGCYKKGRTPSKTIQGIASWFTFIQLSDQGKLSTPYHEPNKASLAAFSNDDAGIQAFVTDRFLWGNLPTEYPDFVTQLTSAIQTNMATYA
ncbi:mannitol dehydrogenase family protein [Marinomonas sp. M1K-6]|uniref:Mannitol dehydrogenase family protein n=1 Tax=Marinomonas profundi TaxID=2726122 RepID=A0A847R915_9GAMM|nr:mannitol dehydrogenase family protein [Marinomonas profundi]NLQ18953.1 mannitol dehydrogenase family protein [Marinomonas profundi]UDV02308.1 mannitol dehydrogenase family protein [Marinomonas profundi]